MKLPATKFLTFPVKTSCLIIMVATLSFPLFAQDLEPRRWSHLPTGGHFLGGGPVVTRGDILFDPVIRAEDAELDMNTVALKYIYSFQLLDKSARVSVQQAHQHGTWSGLLDGEPTTVKRVGATDTVVRFAVNLIGAPPLAGEEFMRYRGSISPETIVGFGLVVQLPTGEYYDDKLINLGSNRYTIRPQFGIVRSWREWSLEATAAVSIFGDNDDFFGDVRLEQDPLFFLQGHLIRSLGNGRWMGLSLGYGAGGETTVNGLDKDNERDDLAWALSYGFALGQTAIKLAYAGTHTRAETGLDSDSLVLTFSRGW